MIKKDFMCISGNTTSAGQYTTCVARQKRWKSKDIMGHNQNQPTNKCKPEDKKK